MKHLLIILTGVLILFSGCRKDLISPDDTTIITPNPGTYITANVNGIVTDYAGNPLANASVVLEGETVTTDELGFFTFRSLLVNKKGGVLTFSKGGYFDNYKVVYPQPGKTNTMKVMMPTKQLSGQFKTADGGVISTNGGASVTFPVNGIMTSDGQPYDGGVNVYTHWYDPTDITLNRAMPGDLRGVDGQGNEVQLATYGMMAVELESPEGVDLNLSEGSLATLNFPLTGIADDAPNTVPLWSFDEEAATWIEEGVATKTGESYIAEVSHFSFWNCDAPFPLVELLGVIKDTQGNLIPFAAMCFEIVGGNPNSWFTTAYGYTNEFGEFFGKIPKDKEIRLTIKDECGNIAYEEVIGPFSENTNIGIIEVQLSGAIMVTGSIADCNGDLVTDGYVVISYPFDWNPEFLNSTIVEVGEDGMFEFVTLYCGPSEVTVQAYDFNSATYSDEITVTVQSGQPLDLGIIALCNDFEEYITYIVDGGGAVLLDAIDLCILDGNAVFTANSSSGAVQSASFTVNNIVEGTNSADKYQFVTLDFQTIVCLENCDEITFEVTTLGTSTGDFVEGTFSGTINLDSMGVETPFEGSFKVKIDYLGSGSSISGVVWDDVNADGIRDMGEPLVEGQFLYLWSNTGVNNTSMNVVTGADGAYTFENLKPGNYYIGIETSTQFTLLNAGADDSVDNDFTPNGVEVELGEIDIVNLDAGLLITNTNDPLECYATVESCFFTGGTIYVTAIGGQAPYTYALNGGLIGSDNAFYNVDEGTYVITVTDANGSVCETAIDVFFEPSFGQVSVWLDSNQDSLLNDFDSLAMIDGIVVELFDGFGNLIEVQNTTMNSSWLTFTFPSLMEYYYVVTAPDGYILVTPIPNPAGQSSDITPSESDPSVGQSDLFFVEDCWGEYYISVGIQEE